MARVRVGAVGVVALMALALLSASAVEAAVEAAVQAPKDVPASPHAGKMTEAEALAASKGIFGALEEWMRGGGMTFPHTEIKYYTSEWRGVVASHDIEPGTVLMHVPVEYTVSDVRARNSTIAHAMTAAGCQPYSSHSWMASFLLQELHDPASHFKHFLASLPRLLDNLPMNFPHTDLEWLRGSQVLPAIVEQADELNTEYQNLITCYPPYKQFTREEFNWASNLVLTRVFGIVYAPGKESIMMVPMADMFNHRFQVTETEWDYNYNASAFQITALEDIPKGQEIYLTYGSKCNTRFFVNYGFALEHNDDNSVVVQLRVPYTDPSYWLKARVLDTDVSAADNNLLGSRLFQVTASLNEPDAKAMFSFARFAAADAEAFRQWTSEESFDVNVLLAECELGSCYDGEKAEDKEKDKIAPLSAENEIGALKLISDAFGRVLRRFPNGIEEDNAILAADADGSRPLTFNQKMSVYVRRGEKLVAQYWRNFAVEMTRLLRMRWVALRPIIDEYIAKYEHYSAYVERVVMRLVQLREVGWMDRYQYTAQRTCTIDQHTKWPTLTAIIGVCPPFIIRSEIETYEYFWRNPDNTTIPISEAEYDNDEQPSEAEGEGGDDESEGEGEGESEGEQQSSE